MIKRPTKAELRDQLNRHVEAFLEHGGEIKEVQQGASGLVDGKFDTRRHSYNQPPQPRTPVPEVVAAIDGRKQSKRSKSSATSRRRQPRYKTIYDDFGEPLRRIRVDD